VARWQRVGADFVNVIEAADEPRELSFNFAATSRGQENLTARVMATVSHTMAIVEPQTARKTASQDHRWPVARCVPHTPRQAKAMKTQASPTFVEKRPSPCLSIRQTRAISNPAEIRNALTKRDSGEMVM
jgi:hypothetical protein